MIPRILRTALAAALILAALPASAFAAIASGATASITAPGFVNGTTDKVSYSATTTSTGGTVFIWARVKASSPNPWTCVANGNTLPSNSSTTGTVTPNLAANLPAAGDGDTIEWLATVDDTGTSCTVAPLPSTPSPATAAQDSSILDKTAPTGFAAAPPEAAVGAAPPNLPVACNTFELFGVAKDPTPAAGSGPSGIASYPFFVSSMLMPLTTSALGPQVAATPGPQVVTRAVVASFPSGTTSVSYSAQANDVAGNKRPAAPITFLSVTSPSTVGACTDYPDLADHWAAVYARYFSTNTTNTPALFQGLPAPSGSGTIFGPDVTMTRAMLAKVLVSAVEPGVTLPTSAPSGCSFSDVPTGQWYTQWVWEACRIRLMQGVGGGLFAPAGSLTRAQAATAVDRLNSTSSNGYLSSNSVVKAAVAIRGTPAFTDVLAGQYYTNAVLDLYARGVIDGTSSTTFGPDQALTRGQLAKILYRALAIATPF